MGVGSILNWFGSHVVEAANSDEAKFLILCGKAYRGDPIAAAEAAKALAGKIGEIVDKVHAR